MDIMIVINIYRDGARWFGARWIGGEYDGCDELDIEDGAPEEVALAEAREMPLLVPGERRVSRVADRDAAWAARSRE